jgi:ribonuclease-3
MKNRFHQMGELEKQLEIKFENIDLLDIATTHSSAANQKIDVEYNERLEFLGDSILQMCITEYLYINYQNKSEGELTKIRSLIVCESSLFEIAKRWSLGNYIVMSKGEELTGGRNRVSILADCVEAIIASIYLDKGMEKVKAFTLTNFKTIIEEAISNKIVFDYKTKLQETLQKNKDNEIIYKLVKYEGPPHRRKFYTQVSVDDKILGNGIGYSKKESEQNAAQEALKRLEEGNE